MITDASTPATSMVENCAAPASPADALPDLGEHVGEHEDEQEGLEDGAGDELLEVPREHVEVAGQQRPERGSGADTGLVRRDGVDSGSSRWSFAEVLPREVDEHGLEGGLGDRQVGDV